MKPIFKILIKPKETFDYLAQQDDDKNNVDSNLLFFLVSLTAGFSITDDINRLIEGNYFIGLLIGLILSGIFGLLFFNTIITYSFLWTSKIFQGKADKNQIRVAIAYSLVPALIQLIFGIIMIVPAIILKDLELIAYQNPIIKFVIWILTIRILLFGLAFFNKYSYGYALLTFVIPTAIFEGILYSIKYMIK